MNDDIKQEDIFPKIRKVAKEVEENTNLDKGIPMGYVPVKFSSKDKLGPAILHFRNFSMGEIYEVASTNEDNQVKVLVNKVLNQMCYEKFDCAKLHIENIKEIMLTIFANFWGNKLVSRPYYIDDEKEDLDSEDNIGHVDLLISKIHINDINDKFKNPFSVIHENTKVTFCLPTVEHSFIAESFVKDYFSNESLTYKSLESRLSIIQSLESKKKFDEASKIFIDNKEKEKYDNFLQKKQVLFLKIMSAQTLVAINDKKFETLDDKLQAFESNLVSIDFWEVYNSVINNNKFGIDDSYEFKDKDGNSITRRFSFRLVDLLPSMDEKKYTGYTVQFDD